MTRVLQVIDGLRIGGAETVLLGLLELTDHDRFPTYVASVGPTDEAFVERVAAASRGVFVVTGRGLWDPRPVARLVSIIRRERIDLVQTHLAGADFQGGLAARLTGRPAVAVLHSVAGDRAGYRRSRRVLADFATRHLAGRIVAVSDVAKQSHVSELGVAQERVTVLPNVPVAAYVLDEGFDRMRKRQELGVGDAPVVSVASRLERPKDHETFLRALPAVVKSHPRLRAVVLGDGPLRSELLALSRGLGLEEHVLFTGARLDAVEVVAAGDVFCHPTLYEGFGLAVAEAMAVGVPVVATRVSGVVDLVEDGSTGVLVPPQDPAALGRALDDLLSDPERRRALGERGRRSIRSRYDPQAWVSSVEHVYAAAVAKGP